MTATTAESIPRAEWRAFFDAFSRRHEGWRATIEHIGIEFGAQVAARSVRFEGISADLKDGECAITVMYDTGPAEHASHTISAPVSVELEKSELETGTFETLGIRTNDGVATLLRFLAGVVPED